MDGVKGRGQVVVIGATNRPNTIDPALRRADFVPALALFARLVEGAVPGHDEMGGVAEQEVGADGHAFFAQSGDFGHEGQRVDHHAVADDADFAPAQDAAGDEVEDEFLLPVHDGVPGVVAALGADDDTGLIGEKVDDFAFAFVAPLGADKNRVGHNDRVRTEAGDPRRKRG